jgi:hypothetical protein
LSPLLDLPRLPRTPRVENGGPFAVDFANGRRDGTPLSSGMRPKIFGSSLRREAGPSSSLVRYNLFGSRFSSSRPERRPSPHRPGDALEVLGAEVLQFEEVAKKPSRTLSDDDHRKSAQPLRLRIVRRSLCLNRWDRWSVRDNTSGW